MLVARNNGKKSGAIKQPNEESIHQHTAYVIFCHFYHQSRLLFVFIHQRNETMSSASRIEYSEKYADDYNEYRHVILPKELAKTLPKSRLLTESEWRGIGVQQSRGWGHYAIHRPEPHILLFRRPLGTDPQSGRVDPELERKAREEYRSTQFAR